MNSDKYEKLVIGYLKGSLSKEEEGDLKDWINSSDENYRNFKRYISENQFSQPHSEETILAWEKLQAKTPILRANKRKKNIYFPTWLKIAALFVFALLSGFFLSQLTSERYWGDVMNEIIVPKGEKAELVLSDGTKVYLHAESRLKYPAIFSKYKREVTLTGEAFFNVKKDKSHPFLIKTPEFDVKVTGTSFNLKTYPEDAWSTLVLHSGIVTITNSGQEFRINPGEKYSFNSNTHESGITQADIQKSILRKEGTIIIDDLDLKDILKVLEREFDVQVNIENENLNKIRYTGQFKPRESLSDVLDLISETSPIKFKYDVNEAKDIITIK